MQFQENQRTGRLMELANFGLMFIKCGSLPVPLAQPSAVNAEAKPSPGQPNAAAPDAPAFALSKIAIDDLDD